MKILFDLVKFLLRYVPVKTIKWPANPALFLQIAAHYGNPRNIEWGIKDGALFMFQSRPITNLDSNFSNYELMHESDTPHSNEHELYSRAHWGENFPGSSSWSAALFFLGGTMFAVRLYTHINNNIKCAL